MIPRIVIDTNLLLSGTFHQGTPGRLLRTTLAGEAQLVISPVLIEEFREKIIARFNRSANAAETIIQELLAPASQVSSLETITICRDQDDDRILECAVAGNANYIVTGDKDLLVLGTFRGIPILTARQFLDEHANKLS